METAREAQVRQIISAMLSFRCSSYDALVLVVFILSVRIWIDIYVYHTSMFGEYTRILERWPFLLLLLHLKYFIDKTLGWCQVIFSCTVQLSTSYMVTTEI